MIELTYYEKKALELSASRLLDLDAHTRKKLGYGDDEPVLVHELLIEAAAGFVKGFRLPPSERMNPDDECVIPSASHLGHTRKEIVEWLARKQIETIEGIPDIFYDIEGDKCPECGNELLEGSCMYRNCPKSILYNKQ